MDAWPGSDDPQNDDAVVAEPDPAPAEDPAVGAAGEAVDPAGEGDPPAPEPHTVGKDGLEEETGRPPLIEVAEQVAADEEKAATHIETQTDDRGNAVDVVVKTPEEV